MTYEQKDNSGSLFKNEERETEKHPNARGSAKIAGVEYWVSAWTKTSENGNKWQSLSFTKKEARVPPKPSGKIQDMADDLPW